jgi:hypothetical protein
MKLLKYCVIALSIFVCANAHDAAAKAPPANQKPGNGTDQNPVGCLGDVNRDGGVDSADLGILLSHMGRNTIKVRAARVADLDGDNFITGFDLSLLLNGWGPCLSCDAVNFVKGDNKGGEVINSPDLGVALSSAHDMVPKVLEHWGACPKTGVANGKLERASLLAAHTSKRK